MAKVICGFCGHEVQLPEQSTFSAGMTISQQSNGSFVLPMANTTTKESKAVTRAEQRIETLRNRGIDTSNYFVARGADGTETILSQNNGQFEVVPMEDDDIINEIIENGYVRNTKLHRRWVMAQMFHMLRDGYEDSLRKHGYMYQWKMVLEEIRVIGKLEHSGDVETFQERTLYFNRDVVCAMIYDYLEKLRAHIDHLPEHKCKGVPYKTVSGKMYFCEDIERKVFTRFRKYCVRINNASSYTGVYNILKYFVKELYKLPYDTKMSADFKDAFKGSGAYYTAKNLILFHNCVADGCTGRTDSYEQLKAKAIEYCGCNTYKLFAWMKKLIADNHYDYFSDVEQ